MFAGSTAWSIAAKRRFACSAFRPQQLMYLRVRLHHLFEKAHCEQPIRKQRIVNIPA